MKPNLSSASLCRPIFIMAFLVLVLEKFIKSWSTMKLLKVITSITQFRKSLEFFLIAWLISKMLKFLVAAPYFCFQTTLKSCRSAHQGKRKAWMTRKIPSRSIINHSGKLDAVPSNDFISYVLPWILVDLLCLHHTGADNDQQISGFAQKGSQIAIGNCRNLCESWGGAMLDCMHLYGKWSIFGYKGRFYSFWGFLFFCTFQISI